MYTSAAALPGRLAGKPRRLQSEDHAAHERRTLNNAINYNEENRKEQKHLFCRYGLLRSSSPATSGRCQTHQELAVIKAYKRITHKNFAAIATSALPGNISPVAAAAAASSPVLNDTYPAAAAASAVPGEISSAAAASAVPRGASPAVAAVLRH